jgi:hypothetical protein
MNWVFKKLCGWDYHCLMSGDLVVANIRDGKWDERGWLWLFWLTGKEPQPRGYGATLDEAKANAEKYVSEWLKSAGLVVATPTHYAPAGKYMVDEAAWGDIDEAIEEIDPGLYEVVELETMRTLPAIFAFLGGEDGKIFEFSTEAEAKEAADKMIKDHDDE